MAFPNLSTKEHNNIYPYKSHHAAFNTNIFSLCQPAFTEASFVSCQSAAFATTVRRLSQESDLDYWGEDGFDETWSPMAMEFDASSASLQRSASHHSNASVRSSRSQTVRAQPRKYTSYMSSSASSISDKSLTSFPSFSPESPRDGRSFLPPAVDGTANKSRVPSDPNPSIVESLTISSPSNQERIALFDDAPLSTRHVPGSIHHANDEHIERLIARNGAVALVRQIAEDLAQRDAQMAALRRKAENRERALRKIILECGLSNLDMETRLRTIEAEMKPVDINLDLESQEGGLEDLMSDAMGGTVALGERAFMDNDATIRARDSLKALESRPANVPKGWKDYIWLGIYGHKKQWHQRTANCFAE
jgi:hypothetical protein